MYYIVTKDDDFVRGTTELRRVAGPYKVLANAERKLAEYDSGAYGDSEGCLSYVLEEK